MGYNRFQFSCVIVEYDLFKPTTFIQNSIYTNFRIIWTQFYIYFSRQEHQIDILYVSFNAWDSQVLSYIPFPLFFTVPLNRNHSKAIFGCFLFSKEKVVTHYKTLINEKINNFQKVHNEVVLYTVFSKTEACGAPADQGLHKLLIYCHNLKSKLWCSLSNQRN